MNQFRRQSPGHATRPSSSSPADSRSFGLLQCVQKNDRRADPVSKRNAMSRLAALYPFALALACALTAGPSLAAGAFTFFYGGRLANDKDEAVAGPVDLELRFFSTASGGTSIPV